MTCITVTLMLIGSLIAQDAKAEEKQKDEEAKKIIAEFHKKFDKAKPDERRPLIVDLGTTQHPRILAELLRLLTTVDNECRKQAAMEIGRYHKDPKAAEGLVRAMRANKEPEVIVAIMEQFVQVGVKSVVKDVAGSFRHKSMDVSKQAISTVGGLRTKDGIPPLLDLLRELDAVQEDAAGGGGAGAPEDDKLKRKRDLTPLALSALSSITAENFATYKEWLAWWNKNKGTFKDKD